MPFNMLFLLNSTAHIIHLIACGLTFYFLSICLIVFSNIFFIDGNGALLVLLCNDNEVKSLKLNTVLNLLLLHSLCNLLRIVQTELVSAYIWQQQALEGAPFRGKTVVL